MKKNALVVRGRLVDQTTVELDEAVQDVTGPVEVKKTGSGLRVKASFPVNLSDYNIPEPRYLGVGVKNTVQVEVTFTATP